MIYSASLKLKSEYSIAVIEMKMKKKEEPEKINIFGTYIINSNLKETVQRLIDYNGPAAYICFPSTNMIALAHEDAGFRKVLNGALMAMPDGKFTEYYCRLKGFKKIKSISGYWLLDSLLKTDCSHFFYGLLPSELEVLKTQLALKYPQANIKGFMSPPIVELPEIKENEKIIQDMKFISELRPDFIWVGISTPKQDYLMYNYSSAQNNSSIMLGVGAVLRYISGIEKISPEWMKKLGIRWIYRLILNPRIYKRMFPGMGLFIKLALLDFIRKPIQNRNYLT